MRLALVFVALLAVAASPRGGCGRPPYEPCAGKACGAACTVCAPGVEGCFETADVKACDAAGECVAADTVKCPGPTPGPCEGKRCGDDCAVDPPCRSATPPCLMPSLAGRCDAAGSCVAADPVCVDPCAGKRCGESCNPCGDANPCPTFAATACDLAGQCVTARPGLCYDPCAGKTCHEACAPCAPGDGACMAVACLTWCDGAGRCVCSGSGAACP